MKYSLQTPEEVATALAARVKALRLLKGWKQVTLAERSGVSLGSLRRFEGRGLVSLQTLLKLVFALNRLDEFSSILEAPPAPSLAALAAREEKRGRKRGRV